MPYPFLLNALLIFNGLVGERNAPGNWWEVRPVQEHLLHYTGLVVNGAAQPLSGVSVLLSGTTTAVSM